MTAPEPIACTLDAADHASRVAWIAELNRSSLQSHRRDGSELELRYAPDARAGVEELVGRERACCAFLRFEVGETRDAIRLRIAVPDAASDAADDLLAPFLAGVVDATGAAAHWPASGFRADEAPPGA